MSQHQEMQRREQIPGFPIARGVWCSFSTPAASLCGPSLNTSGSPFLGTLQNHLEKEHSQVEFDTALPVEGKRQKAWVKGTDPFPKWSSESAQLPANWSHTVTYFRPWRCSMIQTSIRLLFLHLWLVHGWNQSVVPCPVLTFASWPAYRFLKRQVRWSGIPISFRIFHSLLWSTQSKALS